MKILYLSSTAPDYLQDGLLVGLREVLGGNLVDYPKKEWVYKSTEKSIGHSTRKEFTFHRILEDLAINRESIQKRIVDKEFDYIVFSSIHRQIQLLQELLPLLKRKKVIIMDGEDHPSIFPYNGGYWRNYKYWFLPRVHLKYLYFKREYTPETIYYRFYRLIPKAICKRMRLKQVKPISFCFPTSKIVDQFSEKEKLFPEHVVDMEVSEKLGKKTKYVFENEMDYFRDIQKSKYGITTKRSGWDCMRHYEIAANGAVPCFKDMDKKPLTCAPHGLNHSNCIIYSNYQDLMKKINQISETDYQTLRQNACLWAKNNSTFNRAMEFLNEVENHFK
jgi:hypothetical protein